MAVKTVKLILITFSHAILMLYKPRCQHGLFPRLCDVNMCLNSHVFEHCWLMDLVAEVLQLFGESGKCTAKYVEVKQRKRHAVASFANLPVSALLFTVHCSSLLSVFQ